MLPELETNAGFLEWLGEQKGMLQTRAEDSCPVALFLKSTGHSTPMVGRSRISPNGWGFSTNESVHIPWVAQFVEEVDEASERNNDGLCFIPAEVALEIAQNVSC